MLYTINIFCNETEKINLFMQYILVKNLYNFYFQKKKRGWIKIQTPLLLLIEVFVYFVDFFEMYKSLIKQMESLERNVYKFLENIWKVK
jgi:hypothetical protein